MQYIDEFEDDRPNKRALMQQLGGPPGLAAPAAPPAPAFAPQTPVDPVVAPPAEKPKSPFQSTNTNGRGYLEEATRAYQGTLQGIKDEGERERAVEGYLKSLIPELQSRGLNVGDVRKEKMQIDGKWVDLYRDITNGRGSGAAEAQWLEDDGSNGAPTMGGNMPNQGYSLNSLLTGDPMAGIQAALSQYSGPSRNLQALLAQLQGQ